jgi:hypothetical protein
MARHRERTARLQTAYDLGRDENANPEHIEAAIGGDPDLQAAYDRGHTDRMDATGGVMGTETDDAGGTPNRPGTATKRRAATKPAAATTKDRARFSHPLHWGTGAAARHVPKRRTSIGRPTLSLPSRLSASDGSGFMLGVLLYVVVLNYLRYGWPGVQQWGYAKFFNKTGVVVVGKATDALPGITPHGGFPPAPPTPPKAPSPRQAP